MGCSMCDDIYQKLTPPYNPCRVSDLDDLHIALEELTTAVKCLIELYCRTFHTDFRFVSTTRVERGRTRGQGSGYLFHGYMVAEVNVFHKNHRSLRNEPRLASLLTDCLVHVYSCSDIHFCQIIPAHYFSWLKTQIFTYKSFHNLPPIFYSMALGWLESCEHYRMVYREWFNRCYRVKKDILLNKIITGT